MAGAFKPGMAGCEGMNSYKMKCNVDKRKTGRVLRPVCFRGCNKLGESLENLQTKAR